MLAGGVSSAGGVAAHRKHCLSSCSLQSQGLSITLVAAAMAKQQVPRTSVNLRGAAALPVQHADIALALPLLLSQVPYSIGGSGSAYITGWCDKHFREDFTAEEAHAFVVQALTHAMARDASSGGCIRTVTITSSGVKRDFLPGSKVPATYGELQTPQQRVTTLA